MESILNFLANNYLWFLIAAVVLAILLIIFIVDTKRKEKKETEITEENNAGTETEVEELDLTTPPTTDNIEVPTEEKPVSTEPNLENVDLTQPNLNEAPASASALDSDSTSTSVGNENEAITSNELNNNVQEASNAVNVENNAFTTPVNEESVNTETPAAPNFEQPASSNFEPTGINNEVKVETAPNVKEDVASNTINTTVNSGVDKVAPQMPTETEVNVGTDVNNFDFNASNNTSDINNTEQK